jgi:hypothetical protein
MPTTLEGEAQEVPERTPSFGIEGYKVNVQLVTCFDHRECSS